MFFCELQVNDSYFRKARTLIGRSGTKSIIGREWLTTLRYKLQPEKSELEVNAIEKENELGQETKQLVNQFPNLFKRQGKVNNYQIKFNLKTEAKITQQTERRIPIQLQKAVDEEIKRLLKDGHIEKLTKLGMMSSSSRP